MSTLGTKKTKRLHALLVGISKYTDPYQQLDGCLNDLEDFENYLTSYSQNHPYLVLNPLVLKDEQATRTGVINAFTHFEGAEDGDICLFYFTGHGVQKAAHEAFWTEEDRLNEAIVCFDEKLGDHLIVDKELSYLIACATKEKNNIHFLVISDCCHAGSNTKTLDFKSKNGPIDKLEKKLEDYYGYEYYPVEKGNGTVKISPPLANHFHLAACQASQKALQKTYSVNETNIDRSVFTYALLQTLRTNDGKLSYQSLINKTNTFLQLEAPNQTPQLKVIGYDTRAKHATFLEGIFDNQEPSLELKCNAMGQWHVNMGSLHGLRKKDQIFLDEGQIFPISKVYTSYSLINPPFSQKSKLDKKKPYTVSIIYDLDSITKIPVAFTADSHVDGRNHFLKILRDKQSPYLTLVSEGAQFFIHARDNYYALAYPDSTQPIFRRVVGFNDNGAKLFLKQIETMGKWYHISNLNAKKSSIQEEYIRLRLEKLSGSLVQDHAENNSAGVSVDWGNEQIFRYFYDQSANDWLCPGFRLQIKNLHDSDKFWVGSLYCGSEYDLAEVTEKTLLFNVSSRFLEPVELQSGEEVYLNDYFIRPSDRHKIALKTIQLHVLDDYFNLGYGEIQDLLKIFVAKDEFDLTPHNMRGLEMDPEKMAIVRPSLQGTEPIEDWRCFDLPITIIRPKDCGYLSPSQNLDLGSLVLKAHNSIYAKVLLSSATELKRAAVAQKKNILSPNDHFVEEDGALFYLSEGLGPIEGWSIVEFFMPSPQAPTDANPLVFSLKSALREETFLTPYGYFAEAEQHYQSIGFFGGNKISITKFPKPTPSNYEELGYSVKVFFMQTKQVTPSF